ncbi:NAD(P)/FAD-dependent oxidoreductase [Roseateles oligotrophus]|uniref:NAD(P)/FAD-dependent oxidoreductase n=1 Tax=Roseateles oligotrophus TaxID=1769250 RepID=A0ABT2YHT9_9BURK|nr:FAD/NAD(P)-binding oxidoreductase [Roseateles oligotrophus]MCV2369505.1 NAD(P)/FAD-dependent oxidoreductase [Roseateles oligotrophus]
MKTLRADVIIVGAGPTGIAAIGPLLAAGRSVIWIDQGVRPGGQIWRAGVAQPWAKQLAALLPHSSLRCLFGHAVIAAEGGGRLRLQNLLDPGAAAVLVQAPQTLLALGARERFLPFPGWTLPGVSGAGGLQALIKNGWPITGKRVVLAGSGPLLLAAADTARAAGAKLILVAEQASRKSLAGFAARLPLAKLGQAAGLAWRLRGTPYLPGTWVVRALGQAKLEAVLLSDGAKQWELPCEALGVGFGLLPNTELAELLGCRVEAGAIAIDSNFQTSMAGVYAAGECTGIGGVDKALVEGQSVALALLARLDTSGSLRRRRIQVGRFAAALEKAFALRPELLQLADAKTMICRCEDVSLGDLKSQRSWRDAKLQTRCGMGACQGRICGPITQTLLGWPAAQMGRGVRAPLQPTPLACLLDD